VNGNIERLSSTYEMGVWLVNNKKNGYVFVQDYAEKNIEYGDEIVLTTDKDTFERGELLRKIVSLNRKAIEPVVSYLRKEIAGHRDAIEEFTKEYEMTDSVKKLLKNHGIQPQILDFSEREETMLYYKYDRLEELYHRIYHSLIQNIPFETLESFTYNEIDLISRILLAECSIVYEARSFQLNDAKCFIPEIFWNYELRESIKDFLCEPLNCNEDKLDSMIQENIRTHNIIVEGGWIEIVNIRTFSELIALEVKNIMQSSSNFKRCTRCEVCGRLFYKKQGKGENICNYEVLEGELCKNVLNDRYEEYKRKIYNALKSYLQSNAIQGEKIYEDFHKTVEMLIKECRAEDNYDKYKHELDKWYDELKKEYQGFNNYRKDIT